MSLKRVLFSDCCPQRLLKVFWMFHALINTVTAVHSMQYVTVILSKPISTVPAVSAQHVNAMPLNGCIQWSKTLSKQSMVNHLLPFASYFQVTKINNYKPDVPVKMSPLPICHSNYRK